MYLVAAGVGKIGIVDHDVRRRKTHIPGKYLAF
jgi:molybdopterin/thiamine biosynthesis adenylyltransferase